MTAYSLRFWHCNKTHNRLLHHSCYIMCVVYYFLINLWAGHWQHCVGYRKRCGQARGLELGMTIPVCLTSHVDVLSVCFYVCLNSCWADIWARLINKRTHLHLRWRPTQLFYTNKMCWCQTHTRIHKNWYENLDIFNLFSWRPQCLRSHIKIECYRSYIMF